MKSEKCCVISEKDKQKLRLIAAGGQHFKCMFKVLGVAINLQQSQLFINLNGQFRSESAEKGDMKSCEELMMDPLKVSEIKLAMKSEAWN